MSSLTDKLYAIADKGPLRALSLVLALALAGCVFWDPTRFAARTSSLEIWQGLLLIWPSAPAWFTASVSGLSACAGGRFLRRCRR
ncbi:cyd operon protein YbgE [Serratia rubidaea]|uniref:Cyd operon protein YbgE n=1 Tax=Serratia rubidaea TaxID=61652 RepID=A0A447QQV3_SERRU|nr:cyd operon protein YbgE [Serratia rubidaea]